MDKNYYFLSMLKDSRCSRHDVETFLKSYDYDVNYQIPHESLIAKREPKYLGYTALHFAVSTKKQGLVKLLLSLGADVTLKDGNGYTPLRLAIDIVICRSKMDSFMNNSKKVERYKYPILDPLLSAHIKSNNVTNPSCEYGISHFHIACLADNVQVARLFLQAGVSINESVKNTSNRFAGFTPLHFAVKYGTEELVKLLLTHGADVNRLDVRGLSPFGFLVEYTIQTLTYRYEYYISTVTDIIPDKSELLRIDTLIDLIINKEGNENVIDDIGLSFFHASCTKKDTTLVERFLELGTDVNLRVNNDSPMWPAYTPLHFAAYCNPEIFKFLAKKGANMTAPDAKGVTPLDLFIQIYEFTQVCDVLNVHPTIGHISFDNGVKLIKAISAMKDENDFDRFVRDTDVNTRLPGNSPLWPRYTLMHLIVLLSSDKDARITKRVLSNANLTMQDAKGMTPLHLAFRLRKWNIIDKILDEIMSSNVTENCIDGDGLSHLHIACIGNNEQLVSKFLYYGFDPNSPISNLSCTYGRYRTGSTLYHIAAVNNNNSMMKVLTRTGAKADLLDDDGMTAMHVSCLDWFVGLCPTINTLLSLPENRKTNHTAVKAGGLSHLHVACYSYRYDDNYSCDLDFLKELASVATDIDVQINCKTAIDDFHAKQLAEYDGWTPLHFVVDWPRIEAVDILLSNGADVNVKNSTGLSPLHLALLQRHVSYQLNYYNMIKRLYSELKKKGEWCDDYGLTRLHVACFLVDMDEIESLLKAGEDVNIQIDPDSPIWPGYTALHALFICIEGFIRIEQDVIDNIILLIKYGADLTLQNAYDSTPLHHIWEYIRSKGLPFASPLIANAMKKAGPHFYDVNPSDIEGLTHFHISCMVGNVDIVKNFIDSGVDVNESVCLFASRHCTGFTPLHLALQHKNKDVVELLLQCGADLKSEYSRGISPIQEAILSDPTMLPAILSNAQVNLKAETIVFQETTLSLLLENSFKDNYGLSNFQILLDNGLLFNFIDPPARKENIARITLYMDNELFRAFVEKATDVTNIDANGKNVVHSLGYVKLFFNSEFTRCALNVNLWLEKGCDLNLRDKLGRTPLHDAMITEAPACKVLLLLGADVNIRDNQGRTAFSYLEDNGLICLVLNHLLMMSCCGFHLENSLDEVVRREYGEESEERRNRNSDLARMANVDVMEGLSMRDLLREQMVGNFPHFNVEKRNTILEFLRPENLVQQFMEWRDWINIFQIQYREILRRTKLLVPAKVSFYERIYQLDMLCVEIILLNLNNNDLENLIKI